jgi:hypothetical protein
MSLADFWKDLAMLSKGESGSPLFLRILSFWACTSSMAGGVGKGFSLESNVESFYSLKGGKKD